MPTTNAAVTNTVAVQHRSKAGCQQCKRRKRKCDEQHPCCTGCLERNLICNWQQEVKKPSNRKPKFNKDFALPDEMRHMTTIFAAPHAPVIGKLVSHFCTTSPLWLTIGGDKKVSRCLDLIMPALRRTPLVMNCVLAVAAGDLSKYQPASSDMTNLSYGFYGQAVSGIQSALNHELSAKLAVIHTEDDILLAILLLCVHEAVNFTNSDRMFPHINAAAVMCYSRSFSAAQNPPLRGLLFELFCYIFTLTAFSHSPNLQLPLALQVFDSPFLIGKEYQGVLVGISLEIFSIILRVSILIGKTPSPRQLETATRTELELLETRLCNWKPRTAEDTNDDPPDDESIASELYRLACLIHVRNILSPDLALHSSEMQDPLLQFITCLNNLPSTSPANGILCWPLVVAGMCAIVGSHRRLILGRLRKNHETWRTDILSKSAELLCNQWREKTPSTGLRTGVMGVERSEDASAPSVRKHFLKFPIILL